MGFLVGLLLGGAAAVVAFKRLDPVKRQKLINDVNRKASDLKDKAVDYAFYASDAMDNATDHLHKGTKGATSHAKSALNYAHRHAVQLKNHFNNPFNHDDSDPKGSTQFHTAADHLRSELSQSSDSDDIVVDATKNFNQVPKYATVVCYPDGTVRKY